MKKQPTGWEWDVPVTETSYYIWLENGGYQDRWLDEIKDYIAMNGQLTSKQMRLAQFAHGYYFNKVIKGSIPKLDFEKYPLARNIL
jgi:hypothetical protein